VNPCQAWATIARPARAARSASHTMPFVAWWSPKRNQTAIISGAVNSMSSAMPTGSRSSARKYRYCVSAIPAMP